MIDALYLAGIQVDQNKVFLVLLAGRRSLGYSEQVWYRGIQDVAQGLRKDRDVDGRIREG